MNLLPYHSEILVSALSKKEVLGHLVRVTREVNFLDSGIPRDTRIKFNGMIGQEGFRISKVIQKGETFLPLITGEVESTPRGAIIFIRYRLFPAVLFFLIFWSIILLAFTVLYFFVLNKIEYGTICLVLALVNYCLGLFFFHRQVKISRAIFHGLINLQMKDKE